MVNYDGDFFADRHNIFGCGNRGLKYGDGVFETMRAVNGSLFFWEDHYFRLMASMRILRMEIPMDFTLEHLQEEILGTVTENGLKDGAARVRFTVFRKEGGFYTPSTNDVSYLVEATKLHVLYYSISKEACEVELFKDHFVNKDMLSNLKNANKILNVVAGIYAKENGYDNCLLINTDKHVVEAINGNIFLVSGNLVKTPPLKDGCLNGIIRRKIIEIINTDSDFRLHEDSISPFELQKADELFITNSVGGIMPVTKYRKKKYGNGVCMDLLHRLNAKARSELAS